MVRLVQCSSSMVPGMILSSGYSLCDVSVPAWVSSEFPGFFPPPKNMSVGRFLIKAINYPQVWMYMHMVAYSGLASHSAAIEDERINY